MIARTIALLLLVGVILGTTVTPAAAQPMCDAPRVLLVVDKSSSMLGALPGGTTKWDAATTAIGELTTAFAPNVDFGLMLFPHPNLCAPGSVVIPVGENTSETLVGGLGAPPPTAGNYTPMAETIDAVVGETSITDPTHDGNVILITDGWQYCDPYVATTRFNPVGAVGRLRDAGVTVYVVGFGDAVDSLTLNRSATAAGTAMPGCDVTLADPMATGHCYHQANDLAGLRSALDAIARRITAEECDGLDNDCDGMIDEGFDVDADGYTTCGTVPGMPGTTDPGRVDCDDTLDTVHPGAEDVCDGLDNDCDGAIDPACACTDGATQPCGRSVGACMAGTQTCVDGRWDTCTGFTGPDFETCNGLDDDCNGTVDDDVSCGPSATCVDGECVDLSRPVDAGTTLPPRETAPVQEGGCGCSLPGAGRATGTMALALLLLLAVGRRRRRRR